MLQTFCERKTMKSAKLVLHKGKYLVQTSEEDVMKILLNDHVIVKARLEETEGDANNNGTVASTISDEHDLVLAGGDGVVSDTRTIEALTKMLDNKFDSEDDEMKAGLKRVFLFQITGEEAEHVKKRAIELDYPLMEEYDFRNDIANPSISLDLKPIAKIRPYQDKSLEKIFGNGRARSGVIVLPCGAGKSFVGVTAACTLKK